MVIIDTNIIIDHIRQPKTTESHFLKVIKNNPKEIFAISVFSVQELYVGRSTKQIEIEQYLLSIINSLKILPYTYTVAKLAGEIDRDSEKTIQFPDAAIAATAIINDASLYTLNQKDFIDIPNLQLL